MTAFSHQDSKIAVKGVQTNDDLQRLLASLCLSVRPSARMEQPCFHWMDFYEILYLRIFRKSVEKIQVSLKYDKNNGHFTSRPLHIYISLTS